MSRERAVKAKMGGPGASGSRGLWGKRTPQIAECVGVAVSVLAPPRPQGSKLELHPSMRIIGPSRCTLCWWLQGMLLLAQCLELARTAEADKELQCPGGSGEHMVKGAGQRRTKGGRMKCEWEGKGKNSIV